MNYTQLYESRITKELDKKEVSLWKDFYNNILPERVEQFKKVYRGKPQKLQKVIEKLEQDAAASYREEIDEQLTTICDGLRTQAYFDALKQLDSLSEGVPDKADHPQPLASEIIAEQAAEIEKLKAELQDKQENLDICAGLADRYMYRQRIVECTLKLKDEKLLKCAYTYMKKLTEGEE